MDSAEPLEFLGVDGAFASMLEGRNSSRTMERQRHRYLMFVRITSEYEDV